MVSEAGVEPAKPASLVQYLCQFGYTDKWSPERVSNPKPPLFKSSSYTNCDTGRNGVPTRIRTGSPAALNRLRMPFRHRDIWWIRRDLNPHLTD